MTEKKAEKRIQGLYDPDAEGRNYGSLLAFVELSKFRGRKGSPNRSKTPRLRIQKELKKHDRRRRQKHS